MGFVSVKICDSKDLTYAQADALWALYAPHHHVTRARFEERWREMDQVGLFVEGGQAVGMIGIRYRAFEVEGEEVQTIYFGQVFLPPRLRGQFLIQRLVTELYLKARLKGFRAPVMFWSDALSYKPYLIMARNLAEFYPSPDWETPPRVKALLDKIGQHYYPGCYDSETGTVKKPARALREGVADIAERDLSDRHIRFYAARNAGHADGDGLLITCPLSAHNLQSFLQRLVKRRGPRARPPIDRGAAQFL
jgi:hypothetical protein